MPEGQGGSFLFTPQAKYHHAFINTTPLLGILFKDGILRIIVGPEAMHRDISRPQMSYTSKLLE